LGREAILQFVHLAAIVLLVFPWQLGHFTFNLIATFVAATLSYYLVEQPFTRLQKRVQFVPVPAWLLRPQRRPEPIVGD